MILLRFFIAGMLLFMLWRLLRFRWNSRQGGTGKAKRTTATPEEMKKDPVCGTWVPVSQAISIDHHGSPLYFCSRDCREKFLRENSDPPG